MILHTIKTKIPVTDQWYGEFFAQDDRLFACAEEVCEFFPELRKIKPGSTVWFVVHDTQGKNRVRITKDNVYWLKADGKTKDFTFMAQELARRLLKNHNAIYVEAQYYG